MNIREQMQLGETVSVAVNAPPAGADPLAGKAVVHCTVCGLLLCDPYPVAGPAPMLTLCHGEENTREDYAPSVVIDAVQFKATGKRHAVRGEPMAHIRARAQE